MRKTIITISLIGSLLLILQSFGLSDSLLLLVTDGIVPGTNIVVSPIEMLILFSILGIGTLATITISAIAHYVSVNRLAKQIMLKKKRPTQKRRYSRA